MSHVSAGVVASSVPRRDPGGGFNRAHAGQPQPIDITTGLRELLGALQARAPARASQRLWALALLAVGGGGLLVPGDYPPFHLALILLSLLALRFSDNCLWLVIGLYVFGYATSLLFLEMAGPYLLLCAGLCAGCLWRCWQSSAHKWPPTAELGRRLGLAAALSGWLALAGGAAILIWAYVAHIDLANPTSPWTVTALTCFELSTLGVSFGIAAMLSGSRQRLLALIGILPGLLAWLM